MNLKTKRKLYRAWKLLTIWTTSQLNGTHSEEFFVSKSKSFWPKENKKMNKELVFCVQWIEVLNLKKIYFGLKNKMNCHKIKREWTPLPPLLGGLLRVFQKHRKALKTKGFQTYLILTTPTLHWIARVVRIRYVWIFYLIWWSLGSSRRERRGGEFEGKKLVIW